MQRESPQAFAAVIGLRVKELILYSQQRTAHIRSLSKREDKTGMEKKKANLCKLEASESHLQQET